MRVLFIYFIILYILSYINEYKFLYRWHDGAMVSTVVSQQGGSLFETAGRLGPLSTKFAFSSHACISFHQVLQFPSTVQKTCGLSQLATLNCLSVCM